MEHVKKWGVHCAVAVIICVMSLLILKDIAATNRARPQTSQYFLTRIEEGLGSGCPFGGNSGPSEVVNNLATFLASRSDIVLSQAVRNRLIALETQTMYGGRPRKTAWNISSALSDTWFERVTELTNSQIYEIGACTITWVDVSYDDGGSGPMVRCSGELTFGTMEGWMENACAYRDASTPEAVAARAATPQTIHNHVQQRLQVYQEALPSQWNSTMGYTPVQAFLIAYSMMTDDWLDGSASALTNQMQTVEAEIHQYFPGVQTSCVNRKPFGYMGYLYSTHTPYLFTETVQNRLIDRL